MKQRGAESLHSRGWDALLPRDLEKEFPECHHATSIRSIQGIRPEGGGREDEHPHLQTGPAPRKTHFVQCKSYIKQVHTHIIFRRLVGGGFATVTNRSISAASCLTTAIPELKCESSSLLAEQFFFHCPLCGISASPLLLLLLLVVRFAVVTS